MRMRLTVARMSEAICGAVSANAPLSRISQSRAKRARQAHPGYELMVML
jgi:hypothetical protein